MNILQGRDEITGVFRTAWLADDDSKNLPVQYPDVRFDPPDDGAWARLTIQHTQGGETSLTNANGQRVYGHVGIVTVQVFTPSGEGQTLSDTLAMIVANAYRGTRTTGGAVFRNVRTIEVGQTGAWFQVNVTADFDYTEVR